jgi:hypothetical protein
MARCSGAASGPSPMPHTVLPTECSRPLDGTPMKKPRCTAARRAAAGRPAAGPPQAPTRRTGALDAERAPPRLARQPPPRPARPGPAATRRRSGAAAWAAGAPAGHAGHAGAAAARQRRSRRTTSTPPCARAREGAAALAGRQGLRGHPALGGARHGLMDEKDDGEDEPRAARHGAQPGHRRGHHRQRHHPDQPARGVGRQEDPRALRRRPRERGQMVGAQPENDLAVLRR